MLNSSTRVGSNVVQNLRTLVVYHVLHGLLPQLGAATTPSGVAPPSSSADRHDAGAGLSKLLGHVKFSVPLVDWTQQAVEDLRILCEGLASDGSDDVRVSLYVRKRRSLLTFYFYIDCIWHTLR